MVYSFGLDHSLLLSIEFWQVSKSHHGILVVRFLSSLCVNQFFHYLENTKMVRMTQGTRWHGLWVLQLYTWDSSKNSQFKHCRTPILRRFCPSFTEANMTVARIPPWMLDPSRRWDGWSQVLTTMLGQFLGAGQQPCLMIKWWVGDVVHSWS